MPAGAPLDPSLGTALGFRGPRLRTGGATLRPELPARAPRGPALPRALGGPGVIPAGEDALRVKRGGRHLCGSGSREAPVTGGSPPAPSGDRPVRLGRPALPVGPEPREAAQSWIHSLSIVLSSRPPGQLAFALGCRPRVPLEGRSVLEIPPPQQPYPGGRVINASNTPSNFILVLSPFCGRGNGKAKCRAEAERPAAAFSEGGAGRPESSPGRFQGIAAARPCADSWGRAPGPVGTCALPTPAATTPPWWRSPGVREERRRLASSALPSVGPAPEDSGP